MTQPSAVGGSTAKWVLNLPYNGHCWGNIPSAIIISTGSMKFSYGVCLMCRHDLCDKHFVLRGDYLNLSCYSSLVVLCMLFQELQR